MRVLINILPVHMQNKFIIVYSLQCETKISWYYGNIYSLALNLINCSDFTVSSGGSITYPVDTEYIILNPGDMRYHINHVKIVLLYRSYHLGMG